MTETKERHMKNNIKRMVSYYRPYMGTFVADMFFAFLSSIIALVIPMAVRYITSNIMVIKEEGAIYSLVRIISLQI